MSYDDASLSCEVASDSTEFSGGFRNPRISYTREFLMSLADSTACKQLPCGFDQSILSELHAVTPEQHQLLKKEPLFWTTGSSLTEPADRWDNWKLSSKESSPADSGSWRSQHPSPNFAYPWSSRNLPQHYDGILGSWSGSEEPSSEFQGYKPSLLSRCSEPYRPPAFYKVTCHSGGQSHISDDRTSSEDSGNKTGTEERWRKDSSGLTGNEQLNDIKEKQKLIPEDRNEDCDLNARAKLQGCLDVPELVIDEASVPTYLYGSVEPSSTNEAASMPITESASHIHLAQLPHAQGPPSKSQAGQDSGRLYCEEKLQVQLLDESQLISLVDFGGLENTSPIFPDENDILVGEDNLKSQSKFLKWFADSGITDMASSDISHWNGNVNGNKAWGKATGDKNALRTQGAPFSEQRKAIVAESGFSFDSPHSSKPQSNKSTTSQSSGTASGGSSHSTKTSDPKTVAKFAQETDSTLKTLLHDEDSVITIDDTFIFQQDERKPSPNISSKGGKNTSSTAGSNIFLEYENLDQILSLPDPWSKESQINAQKLFLNPSNNFQDPRMICHKGYDPFAANLVSHPFGQLLVEPPQYKPSVQQFAPPAAMISPQPRNTISPYCQPPTPFPISIRSPALHFQRNGNPTLDARRTGFLGEEGSKSAFCHLLQMQMRLAQMHLDAAASGANERVYCKPLSPWYR